LRHATDGDAIQRLQSCSSLTSFFESESSEDEEIDVAALKDLTPAFSGVDCSPSVEEAPSQDVEMVLAASADTEVDVAQQTAEADVKEAESQKDGEGTTEAEAQSLRDTYQLPRAQRRKKKKKKDAEALAVTAALPPSTTGGNLEAEAATFRTALSGALFAASVPSQVPQAPPRPTKRKNTTELGTAVEASIAVASDPYAVSSAAADPQTTLVATHDPYAAAVAATSVAAASDPYAEAPPTSLVRAVPTAAAVDGRPRKKEENEARTTAAANQSCGGPVLVSAAKLADFSVASAAGFLTTWSRFVRNGQCSGDV